MPINSATLDSRGELVEQGCLRRRVPPDGGQQPRRPARGARVTVRPALEAGAIETRKIPSRRPSTSNWGCRSLQDSRCRAEDERCSLTPSCIRHRRADRLNSLSRPDPNNDLIVPVPSSDADLGQVGSASRRSRARSWSSLRANGGRPRLPQSRRIQTWTRTNQPSVVPGMADATVNSEALIFHLRVYGPSAAPFVGTRELPLSRGLLRD